MFALMRWLVAVPFAFSSLLVEKWTDDSSTEWHG
jgi:hypothetical protein